MKGLVALLWVYGSGVAGCAQTVIFYGGDFDGNGGTSSERNTSIQDARVYDDFDISQPTLVEAVWGNFLLAGLPVPKMAYYEIRKGLSSGNGGMLLASGNVKIAMMYTGRTYLNVLPELQIRGRIAPLWLPAGRYWLTIAPVGFGRGRFFASETSGRNEPPPTDPNPAVTGGPIGNDNAFFDSPDFGDHFSSWFYDFSFGVGALTTVARSLSLADSFAITRGVGTGGGLYDLWGPDDRRLVVQQRFPINASSPNVQVVAETATPVPANPNGNRLTLTVEARCTATPLGNVVERIEVFDFAQSRWIIVSEQSPSSTDRQTVVTRTGGFVEPGTNRLMARVGWFDRGVINLNWTGEIDWILWDISP